MAEPVRRVVKPRVSLTHRQADVLRELLKDGAENARIGRRLYVTEDTVKTHVKDMLRLFHVNNRTELVIKVLSGDVEWDTRPPIRAL